MKGKAMFLLHAHTSTEISFGSFMKEVVLDGFLDTLKILPFLFLTYLFMEFIEHRASEKTLSFMKKSGSLGPLVGGTLGLLPQCAFSAVASNLYTGRVVTLGTLVAVFLSTSDEMLPLLIGEGVKAKSILLIILYKGLVAIAMGFTIDILMRLCGKKKAAINIDEICENDNCHCEKGIFHSAIHHTVTISILIFAVTLVMNSLVFFVGNERLSALGSAIFGISHLIFALLGLIPGCATSVAISSLGIHGVISTGAMLAGLFPNAGVGMIILFKFNTSKKENFMIMGILVIIGFVFGMLADLIGIVI